MPGLNVVAVADDNAMIVFWSVSRATGSKQAGVLIRRRVIIYVNKAMDEAEKLLIGVLGGRESQAAGRWKLRL